MKTLITIALALVIGGCASLDDFQKMTASERAQKSCNKIANKFDVGIEIRNLQSEINKLDLLLERGYSPNTQCKWVERIQPFSMRCSVSQPGVSMNCNDNRGSTGVYSCAELSDALEGRITLPINVSWAIAMECERKCITFHDPLNYDDIYRKKSGVANRISQLESQFEAKYSRCFSNVVGMSAVDAYRVYKNGVVGFNGGDGVGSSITSQSVTRVKPTEAEIRNIGAQCKSDAECVGRLMCRSQYCKTPDFMVNPNPVADQCKVDIDCPGTDLCRGGKCRKLQ
jgi:hypothetical protein